MRAGDANAGSLVLLQLPSGRDVAAPVRALSINPAVDYAEPNWRYTHQDASNDTFYTNGSLWGMTNTITC